MGKKQPVVGKKWKIGGKKKIIDAHYHVLLGECCEERERQRQRQTETDPGVKCTIVLAY